MVRARIDAAAGAAAVERWRDAEDREAVPREVVALATRFLLQKLGESAKGNSVEVRVPPFGAVQCVAGPGHTRGTPPNVIEMTAQTWLALACGDLDWEHGVSTGQVRASGVRADLRGLLPLV